ncbi:hypothetical protein PILCRDRAFT_687117 [Piloderma croceum F 1598]|uniref:Uncharacterized protein n=1 Tax=Piloderma croceum (strain F 1598) TaxID=765440 RepID=A0A0C3F596_PILCF|nr:hypothetical protein PILCRDRAFT_687117 [Piloderma croceum F 1598]
MLLHVRKPCSLAYMEFRKGVSVAVFLVCWVPSFYSDIIHQQGGRKGYERNRWIPKHSILLKEAKKVIKVHGKRILAHPRDDKSKNISGESILQLCLSIKIMQLGTNTSFQAFIGRLRDLETGTICNTAKRGPFGLKLGHGSRLSLSIVRLAPSTVGERRPWIDQVRRSILERVTVDRN